jgi:hypothetical protein
VREITDATTTRYGLDTADLPDNLERFRRHFGRLSRRGSHRRKA